MTDQYNLSAKAQELMRLAPELVGQFKQVPIVDHKPPETFEGLSWFVAQTNIKCERRAQMGLRRKGYQTYLPIERKHVARSRKLIEVENPLLPRYLFVGLRDYGMRSGQDFFGMRNVDGLEKIVRVEGVPIMIKPPEEREGHPKPAHPLALLLDREKAGEFDHIRRVEEEKARKDALRVLCKPGARVSLTSGPMTGLQAVVQRVQAGGRIEVLIDFLGGMTRADLKIDGVELLEAAE